MPTSKYKKWTFKKVIGLVHLWLGLASGVVIVFLGLTGCLLAFEVEIRTVTDPEQYSGVEDRPYLPPTVLKAIAERHLDGNPALTIEYPGRGRSAIASWYDADHYLLVALNPYSGKVLKVKNMNSDFFRIILDGHYYLFLPPSIGQPIVASATLIFLIMIITGLVLWWPRNRAARKQRFSIKWRVTWRRKNYDLHNVLGFYISWIAIFVAITGLVWGFEWMARSVYWVSSGGRALSEDVHPLSDTTMATQGQGNQTNVVWANALAQIKSEESVTVTFAQTPADIIEVAINHLPGTYYNVDYYHYDQYSGKELPATGSYAGRFDQANAADKIRRMNYDIHVGAILGLPGKILAFCASLVAASLPITGFIIWWGRRRKRRRVTVTSQK